MIKVLIFGGTTEGRELARACVSMQIKACVCVASEYGEQLLPADRNLRIHTGRLERREMIELIREMNPELVLDATHPYADIVSEQVLAACMETGTAHERVLRQESTGFTGGQEVWVSDVAAAVAVLRQDRRPVLVTTGSKELGSYGMLADYQTRIYARVLPGHDGIRACEELGLAGSHIIAMQGPFSRDLNRALLKQINAGWLVTKESGKQGGFLEKLEAAAELGVRTIIIGRPRKENGISLAEACRRLAVFGTARRQLFLIGIGMGSAGLITEEAKEAICRCDAIAGADRMLRLAKTFVPGAAAKESYLPSEIAAWLEEHPEYHTVGVMLSGDTGFYSGAKTLQAVLKEAGEIWQIRMLPGISTVSYLCARLGTAWDDVYLCSMHGRSCDLPELIRQYPRVFCLLGGDVTVRDVCKMLRSEPSGRFRISAGEALSYPEEQIATGTPEAIGAMAWGKLAAVLIERI